MKMMILKEEGVAVGFGIGFRMGGSDYCGMMCLIDAFIYVCVTVIVILLKFIILFNPY